MKDILFGKVKPNAVKKSIEFVDVLNSPNCNYILFTNVYNIPNKQYIENIDVEYAETGKYIDYVQDERNPFTKYIAFVEISSKFENYKISLFDTSTILDILTFEITKTFYDSFSFDDNSTWNFNKISKEDVILTDKLSRIVGFNRTIQTQSVISDLLSIRYDKQLKYDPTFISDVATLNPNKIRSDDFHHSESGEIFRYDYTLEEYVLHSDRYAGELSTF